MQRHQGVWILLATFCSLACSAHAEDRPIHVTIGAAGQFVVDGKDVFPIGFTTGPPTGAKAPNGNNAFAELAKNGFVFFQWLSRQLPWDAERAAEVDSLMQEAKANGVKIAPSVAVLTEIHPGDQQKTAQLEEVIRRYRNNPTLFLWKGADEPQWRKVPTQNLGVFYDTIHRLDPDHPVWITQAPRGTPTQLLPYAKYYDVGAVDIYAIGYPPGTHSGIANKEMSVVGDYTLRTRQVDGPQKGLMMTLQICWSGVIKPGKTLRFPTFPEQRYMSYQAIIDGARALLYFGGGLQQCLSEEDRPYGWNWRFYRRVLEPVLEEFRPDSPLYPALVAPDSQLPVRVTGGSGLEFKVRQAGTDLFILAAKREGTTSQFSFSGLPGGISGGEVLFEPPRQVQVKDGKFTDWFGPNEVHVYRFKMP